LVFACWLFELLDTLGGDGEEFEGGLLERGFAGMEGEAVFRLEA